MSTLKDIILPLTLLMVCAVSYCHGAQCKLLFHDCGSKEGTLNSAMFNGSCPGGKAELKHGTTVAIEFNFSAKKSEASLKSKVAGKIGELPFVPFPLGNADVCKDENSGVTCPVPANTNTNYLAVFDVKSAYPKVNVIVRWELQNGDGVDVFCALIPAFITS